MDPLFLAAGTALSTAFLIIRVMPMRWIVRYHILIDIAASAFLIGFFSGTQTGAVIAMLAGLMLSLALSGVALGYKLVRAHPLLRPLLP